MSKWGLVKAAVVILHLGMAGIVFALLSIAMIIRRRWSLMRVLRASMSVMVVFVACEAAAISYVWFIEPNWITVTHLHVHNDRLADTLGSARVVQITDLHINYFGPREGTMIWQVNRHHPDWIVITGDLINGRDGWPDALKVVSQLQAAHGVWVIPGNTDNQFLSSEEFDQGLAKIGAHVLRNARVPMGDTRAWLIGVDDPVNKRDRLDVALSGMDPLEKAASILLAHSPDILPAAVEANLPLVLVGHTHGGQVGIAWIRKLSAYADRGPYVGGGLYHEHDTQLYVNRGIGSKTRPFRFLCPPEVAVMDFRPATRSGGFHDGESATTNGRTELWLSDFETSDEHAIRWNVRDAFAALSREHATHGHASARITFQDTEAPKFAMEQYLARDRKRRNWSGYDTLQFDLYNAQTSQERLILQLQDQGGHLYKEDVILPGNAQQHVTVSLHDVAQYLDLTHIVQLNLFRWHPTEPSTFYLDAVHLERSPVSSSTSAPSPAQPVAPSVSRSAVLTGKSGAQWQVGWTSGLTKLFRDPKMFQGHTSNPVQVSLARGEYESVQLALIGGAQPSKVKVSVGPVTLNGDTAVIPANVIEIRRVGYVHTHRPYYPVTLVGDWPDPLPLADEVEVPAKQLQPVWVTIGAPISLPAGRYDGTITFTDADGWTQSLALQVTVWDFTLPRTSHLKTAFDFYRSRLEKAYHEVVPGGEQWTGKLDELQHRYFLNLLKHRLSPVWNADPTKPKFAWEVKQYLDRGLVTFGIGERGGSQENDWPTDPVRLEQAMVWYRQAALELKMEKLIDQAYVYAYDEPTPGDPHVAQVMAALHHTDPELKTLLVMRETPDPVKYAEWLKDVDILCLHVSRYDPDQVAQFKRMGKEVWMYVSAPAHPYPSLVIDYPAMASRILPWMAWKYGADGLLYWCVNFWDGDPWTNPAGFAADQNGNGALYYPTAEGPVPSIRLEALRDGIEDYEYLFMLRELIQTAKTTGGVDPTLLAEAERLIVVDRTLVESLRSYAKDPKVLFAQRHAIAEMIVRLQHLLHGPEVS